MKTLIISGGQIEKDFLEQFLRKNKYDYLIGVDKGIEMCHQCGLKPSVIMGDFDSADSDIREKFESDSNIKVFRFNPQKDDTDTQMAINHAIEKGSSQIILLGATGTRIDHLLANLQCLYQPLEAGIECFLIDKNNKIELLKDSCQLRKSEQYGDYVSLLPFTDQVMGLTLKGFKYPLDGYTLTKHSGGFGVSNEIVLEEAEIIFHTGILIMIQSKD